MEPESTEAQRRGRREAEEKRRKRQQRCHGKPVRFRWNPKARRLNAEDAEKQKKKGGKDNRDVTVNLFVFKIENGKKGSINAKGTGQHKQMFQDDRQKRFVAQIAPVN